MANDPQAERVWRLPRRWRRDRYRDETGALWTLARKGPWRKVKERRRDERKEIHTP